MNEPEESATCRYYLSTGIEHIADALSNKNQSPSQQLPFPEAIQVTAVVTVSACCNPVQSKLCIWCHEKKPTLSTPLLIF